MANDPTFARDDAPSRSFRFASVIVAIALSTTLAGCATAPTAVENSNSQQAEAETESETVEDTEPTQAAPVERFEDAEVVLMPVLDTYWSALYAGDCVLLATVASEQYITEDLGGCIDVEVDISGQLKLVWSKPLKVSYLDEWTNVPSDAGFTSEDPAYDHVVVWVTAETTPHMKDPSFVARKLLLTKFDDGWKVEYEGNSEF